MDGAAKGCYLLGIFALAALPAKVISLLPPESLQWCSYFTIRLVLFLCHLIGIPADALGNIFAVSGFHMRMVAECTAIHFVAFLAVAILIYPRHKFSYKLAGIAVGTFLVVLLNAFRLILLGLVGAHFPSSFNFIHDYIWQSAFALLVFLIWLGWVERKPRIGLWLRFAGVALGTSAACLAVLPFVKLPITRSLAWIADRAMILIHGNLPLSTKLWLLPRANQIQVAMKGGAVAIDPLGANFIYGPWLGISGIALCFGLIIGSVVIFKLQLQSMCRRLTIATIIMALVNVAVLTCLALAIKMRMPEGYVHSVLVGGRGLCLVAPLLVWLLVCPREVLKNRKYGIFEVEDKVENIELLAGRTCHEQ